MARSLVRSSWLSARYLALLCQLEAYYASANVVEDGSLRPIVGGYI